MESDDSLMSIPSGKFVPFNQLSFRKPFLLYLKTNAPPRLLLKLMQISRYFCFKEFPYMVVKDLSYYNGEWVYLQLGIRFFGNQTLDLYNLPKPLWICNELYLFDVNDLYVISQLISKIAVCDVKNMTIVEQQIKINQFQFLISSNAVEEISFGVTEVFYDDGNVVPVEEIVKMLPNLKRFEWEFNDPASEFSLTSTAKLIEYINPSILTRFELKDIPEIFDFKLFAEFMDKTPSIYFYLSFNDEISDEYAKILQAYVDKLIKAGEYNNRQMFIEFPQQNYDAYKILDKNISYQ